jgi:hypothetical protein
LSVPVDDHFPVIAGIRRRRAQKPTAGARKAERGCQRRHIRFPSLRSSCSFTPLRRKRLTFRSPLSSEYEARFKVAMQKVTRKARSERIYLHSQAFPATPRGFGRCASESPTPTSIPAQTRPAAMTFARAADRLCRPADAARPEPGTATRRGRESLRWFWESYAIVNASFPSRVSSRGRKIAAKEDAATRPQLAVCGRGCFGRFAMKRWNKICRSTGRWRMRTAAGMPQLGSGRGDPT